MKQIKIFDPVLDIKEEKELVKVLKSGNWASGEGTGNVGKFETDFKKYIGSDSCVAVNSRTAALHLALSMCDIKNKEVILPSLSFVSTANAILYNGGKPIFVDVEPKTLCLDPEKVKEKINEKTKVILPVHFGGMPANLTKFEKLTKNNDLILVEDAAHASGTEFDSKKIGSHGKFVCFSFHPVKNLAMPTGGAITINSTNLKKTVSSLKSLRWCGITNRKNSTYDVKEIGWNYYMNEFSAAIGLTQLKKLEKMNKTRKNIAKRYFDEINLDKMPYDRNCVYHLFWIRVKNRKQFRKKMLENGIETGIHYNPIHKMTLYKSKIKLDITEKCGDEIVSIPIHPNLKNNDVSKIIKNVNKFS